MWVRHARVERALAEALDAEVPSRLVDGLLCAHGVGTGETEAAIAGCLGVGLVGIRALVWDVREAAKQNADIARFLDSPMMPPGVGRVAS